MRGEKLVEDQDTILERTGKIQELQNEINCMNDSRDFQDAESVRSGHSHVTSQPTSFPPHPIPGGMLRHSFVSPSRREGPPSIWDAHSFSGNVFVDLDASNSFHEETVSSDRSGQPVVETSKTQTRSSDDSKSLNVELAHDRSEQRVVNHDDSSRDQPMLNEVNMDFRIAGLPHSVMKHAQSTSVRGLVQKIQNHPNRHALRQNQAYNPFSPESKQKIQDAGNVELFELLETESKTQCKACLSFWSEGIVDCTCGHLLIETVTNRGFIAYTLDLLSIPEYVIKK